VIDDSITLTERLKVLYLFSGRVRKSGLGSCLKRQAKEKGVKVEVKEVDIIRGRKHNMLSKAARSKLIVEIDQGMYDIVVASPPCSSFSRARSSGKSGPMALRSRKFPLGFPWLRRKAKATVRDANILIEFAQTALLIQAARGGQLLLEHPEDLGITKTSEFPASIWQGAPVQQLLEHDGVVWGACRQSEWGADFSKPTRLLGRLSGLTSLLRGGPPTFDDSGKYSGLFCRRPRGRN